MILLLICYLKYLFLKPRVFAVLALIQKLKRFRPSSFFKIKNNTRQPLINDKEILELLYRVQSDKKSQQYKKEIAFRQIGDVRSIYRGHGMDYEESRRYQVGDDPRYMNWQLSARTGQHYMRSFVKNVSRVFLFFSIGVIQCVLALNNVLR